MGVFVKKKKKNSRELKRGGSQYSLWQKARLYFQNNQCKKGLEVRLQR
jgi:hypothetical protein